LIVDRCWFTDDTVLTIAVADAIIHKSSYADCIRKWARKYPNVGYGGRFIDWVEDGSAGPYNSWGNGSAMRVSAVGYLPSLKTVLEESKKSAECTHNHPEGIKGAQATAACIYMARTGKSKEDIKSYVETNFEGYDLNRSIKDDIRPTYRFDVSCQGSVPESIIAFLEGTSYEDTIRLAINLGGDADTQAAIAGSIAYAYYKSRNLNNNNPNLEHLAMKLLPKEMIEIINKFDSSFGDNNIGNSSTGSSKCYCW